MDTGAVEVWRRLLGDRDGNVVRRKQPLDVGVSS